MPLPLTTAARAAIATGHIAHAWLIELFTDEESLRAWDKNAELTFESNTFEGLSSTWGIVGEINLSADLVPRPLTFKFDGGAQTDGTSFVGKLVANQWHQRRMRLRGLLLDPGTNFQTIIGTHLDWTGYMDVIETDEADGSESDLSLTCEGGIFRALDRNMTTCTHPDQQRRDATDMFFRNTASKPTQDIPFGTGWSNVPGYSGRSGSGGGSTTTGSITRLGTSR